MRKSQSGGSSTVSVDADGLDANHENPEIEKGQFEEVKPLAEELLDALIDLLFFAEFTIPANERTKPKVNYSIWTSGVGCNASIPTNGRLENNRTEVVRLLLTLASKSMYMPSSKLCITL